MKSITNSMAVLITFFLFANAAWAQTSSSVPYEVRSKFREGGCEVIIAQEAMRTDLKRQVIYVASCSGLETYLMAVKCRGTSCEVMR